MDKFIVAIITLFIVNNQNNTIVNGQTLLQPGLLSLSRGVALYEFNQGYISDGQEYHILTQIPTTQKIVLPTGCTDDQNQLITSTVNNFLISMETILNNRIIPQQQKHSSREKRFLGSIMAGTALGEASYAIAELKSQQAILMLMQSDIKDLQLGLKDTNQAVSENSDGLMVAYNALDKIQLYLNTTLAKTLTEMECDIDKAQSTAELSVYFTMINTWFTLIDQNPSGFEVPPNLLSHQFEISVISSLPVGSFVKNYCTENPGTLYSFMTGSIIAADIKTGSFSVDLQISEIIAQTQTSIMAVATVPFIYQDTTSAVVLQPNHLINYQGSTREVNLDSCKKATAGYICPVGTLSAEPTSIYHCLDINIGTSASCQVFNMGPSSYTRYWFTPSGLMISCNNRPCICMDNGAVVSTGGVPALITSDQCKKIQTINLVLTVFQSTNLTWILLDIPIIIDNTTLPESSVYQPVDISSIKSDVEKSRQFVNQSNYELDQIHYHTFDVTNLGIAIAALVLSIINLVLFFVMLCCLKFCGVLGGKNPVDEVLSNPGALSMMAKV